MFFKVLFKTIFLYIVIIAIIKVSPGGKNRTPFTTPRRQIVAARGGDPVVGARSPAFGQTGESPI